MKRRRNPTPTRADTIKDRRFVVVVVRALVFCLFCRIFSFMQVIKAYRFRLYPTEFQEELFRRWAGSCRWLYNLALEQRELFSRRGRSIGYNDQAAELKTLKADEAFGWLAETPNQCLQQALMDLQKAFTNFFEGRASYPKRRKKFENDAFRFPALEQKAIRMVKGQKVIGPDGKPERLKINRGSCRF